MSERRISRLERDKDKLLDQIADLVKDNGMRARKSQIDELRIQTLEAELKQTRAVVDRINSSVWAILEARMYD